MRTTFTIDYLLRQWSLEFAMYRRNKAIYDGYSRIYKFFVMPEQPQHPGYRSFRLVNGACHTIELGFLSRPILKCCDEYHHGYQLDIITGEKSPCLGARGMVVSSRLEGMMQSYAKDIKEAFEPYINNIK